jgi:hypothetical protein
VDDCLRVLRRRHTSGLDRAAGGDVAGVVRCPAQDGRLPRRVIARPDPAFLAHTHLNDDLTAAVRRHAPNEASLRWALLPITVRDLLFTALPAVVTALPALPNPVTFIQIACEDRKIPLVLRDWIVSQAYGAAIPLLHVGTKPGRGIFIEHCNALAHTRAGPCCAPNPTRWRTHWRIPTEGRLSARR